MQWLETRKYVRTNRVFVSIEERRIGGWKTAEYSSLKVVTVTPGKEEQQFKALLSHKQDVDLLESKVYFLFVCDVWHVDVSEAGVHQESEPQSGQTDNHHDNDTTDDGCHPSERLRTHKSNPLVQRLHPINHHSSVALLQMECE